MHSFPQFTSSNLLEWGQLFSRKMLWYGGNFPGGNFPRDNYPGAIFLGGYCPRTGFELLKNISLITCKKI